MKSNKINAIVIGSISTDIIASGVRKIVGPGESARGKELRIGPGGKAVNVSRMMSALTDINSTAIIGKTSIDPYNLWKVPIDALKTAGVNTDFVQIVSFEKAKKYPSIALIPVDIDGNNQIYGLRGIGMDFFKEDIENASSLFETAHANNGILILSLQIPLETAIYAVALGSKYNLKVLLDPGGVQEDVSYDELLSHYVFLLKPNEHEAKRLTGVTVSDFSSAKKAADVLLQRNIQNVLITHGKNGGYLFGKNLQEHIPIPTIENGAVRDETGCGDQTIAALAAALTDGKDILDAAKTGILAGTLQFGKSGIVPVTRQELEKYS